MLTHAQAAARAIELVRPSIEALFQQTPRQELHIVILDPRVRPWDGSFEDAILLEHSIRNAPSWEKPFDEFARNKALQSWRAQRHSMVLQQQHPSSLHEGDLPFYGSFVYGDIVVACSGVQPWFDMLISGWIALAFEQLMIDARQPTP